MIIHFSVDSRSSVSEDLFEVMVLNLDLTIETHLGFLSSPVFYLHFHLSSVLTCFLFSWLDTGSSLKLHDSC